MVVVYTCIVGNISDRLHLPLGAVEDYAREARFVCFSDRRCPGGRYGPWEVFPPAWRHPTTPRRTARWHKTAPHQLFPGHTVSVWMDGCFELRVSPSRLVELGLAGGSDIATFQHPERDCIYQEAVACKRLRKDDPITIDAQMSRYASAGYPAHNGLVESTCVIRRATPAVRSFSEAWWAEMAAGSLRDQLSFNYVAWKLGVPFSHVDGWRNRNAYFNFQPHTELPQPLQSL